MHKNFLNIREEHLLLQGHKYKVRTISLVHSRTFVQRTVIGTSYGQISVFLLKEHNRVMIFFN